MKVVLMFLICLPMSAVLVTLEEAQRLLRGVNPLAVLSAGEGREVQQNTIRVGVLVAWALWVIVGGLFVAGWLTWLLGYRSVGGALTMSAAVVVGPATVVHVRLYACRLAFLVRTMAASSSEPIPPAPLRSVGG